MYRRIQNLAAIISRHAMFILIAVVFAFNARIGTAYAEDAVVLIAAKGSGIEAISNRDIRRIFLGLKSADSDLVNKPVINLYNKEVYDAFLKNVMHMTEGAYKRKLVKRIFRNGAEEIKEIDMLDQLGAHLANNVGDISFVDRASVEKMDGVEIVKILWQR